MKVPDVFQTAFQTAPLDLGTVVFYPSRRDAIDTRLSQVREGQGPALLQECWQKHVGEWCRGVNWDRHGTAFALVPDSALLQQLLFVCRPSSTGIATMFGAYTGLTSSRSMFADQVAPALLQ